MVQDGILLRETPSVLNGAYRLRVSWEAEDPEWDAFLERTPGGHHVQTSLWGQVKALLGWRAVRVVVTKGGGIAGGFQMLMRHVSFLGGVGYVPRGPLCVEHDPALVKLLMGELRRVAGKHHVRYVVLQPPCNSERLVEMLPDWGFRPSSVCVGTTATVLIDPVAKPEEIMRQMRRSTRQNVRRGLSSGITVREGTGDDIDTFCTLLKATGRRQKFSPHSKEYFTGMWRILRPRGYINLLIAEYEGEPVSAHLFVVFGGTVLLKKVGWSGNHGELRPNDVLHWHLIEWARHNGCRQCDLEGIDRGAAEKLIRGELLPPKFRHTPTYFKLGFGGEVVLFPCSYDYVLNQPLRHLYNTVFSRVMGLPGVVDVLERLGRN